MTSNGQDVTKLLQRATIKKAGTELTRKGGPGARGGPAAVPELDPHMQLSYETEEVLEVVVPEWAVAEIRRKLKASARHLGYQWNGDVNSVKVTIQTEERKDGKVAVRFKARPPMETGSRAKAYSRDYDASPPVRSDLNRRRSR